MSSVKPVDVFHRKANKRSQTLRDGIDQKKSGELWGKGAFGGHAAALAYFNGLPEHEEGTEFTTDIPYALNGHPQWAYWYLPEHGGDERVEKRVVGGKDYAAIRINVLLSRYRCK